MRALIASARAGLGCAIAETTPTSASVLAIQKRLNFIFPSDIPPSPPQHGFYSSRVNYSLRIIFWTTGGYGPETRGLRSARYELQGLDQPCPYQHCRQTQNCHCEKCHRVGRHLCQKLDHLPPPSPSRQRRKNAATAREFNFLDNHKRRCALHGLDF